MFAFLLGMMLIYLPCDIKWSLLDKDTVIVFNNYVSNEFCVDYVNTNDLKNFNTSLKLNDCVLFDEQIQKETVFENNKTVYLIAKSLLDNATLFYINDKFKMKVFDYQKGMWRYNIFTETIFRYHNHKLYEYSVKGLINFLTRQWIPSPIKVTTVSSMEDFYFVDKNTIMFLSDGKIYLNAKEPHFVQNATCLPYYSPVYHYWLIKMICIFSTVFLFIFVFTGTPLANFVFKKHKHIKLFREREKPPSDKPLIENCYHKVVQ